MLERAQDLIRTGFVDLETAVDQVREHYEGEPGSPDDATVDRVVRAAWQQRLAEQRSWPDLGDYGRLAAAFADLEQAGFTARMNFACCQNCGHTEIEDERGPGQHSYVFFHQQDSERLADPDATLYLAYSYFGAHPDYDRSLMQATEASDDPDLRTRAKAQHERVETAVGAQIVQALARYGLEASWSGTNSSRPAVRIREWRKPLPA